jgi:hypothetical protein
MTKEEMEAKIAEHSAAIVMLTERTKNLLEASLELASWHGVDVNGHMEEKNWKEGAAQ